MDVLIFINGNKICRDVARFLGLIFLDGCSLDADMNTDINEVLQIRTSNKNAYTWRLIQGDINPQLMSGCSTICLTCNYNIFSITALG